eukprot:220073-Pyramimonas_sp.AAC.1
MVYPARLDEGATTKEFQTGAHAAHQPETCGSPLALATGALPGARDASAQAPMPPLSGRSFPLIFPPLQGVKPRPMRAHGGTCNLPTEADRAGAVPSVGSEKRPRSTSGTGALPRH